MTVLRRHGSMVRAAVVFAGLAAAPAAAAAAPAAGPAPTFAPMEMRAQLTPHRFTTLSAEIAAKIERVTRRDGETFKEGDLLVEFDCTLQAAQLAKARAHLQGVESTLEGQRTLASLNAIGTVEVKTTEAEVAKAKADIAYLKAMMDKCRVTAPFAGRVVEQKARGQQFVQAGQALMDILDDSVLELEFIVPSQWLTWLTPGHRFSVRIDDTGRDYPVRLARTAARVDPVSQTVKGIAVVDGRFPELLAGMSGQVLLSPPQK